MVRIDNESSEKGGFIKLPVLLSDYKTKILFQVQVYFQY